MLNVRAIAADTPQLTAHEGNIEAIQYLAQQQDYAEICGAIINGKLHPCANIAADPSKAFKLTTYSSRNIASARRRGETVSVYHSHPAGLMDDFSSPDIRMLDELGVEGLLVILPHCNVKQYDPAYIPPYEERQWAIAYRNCYTLVRDFYLKEYGIKLGRYYFDSIDQSNQPSWDEFGQHFEDEGFKDVRAQELRAGDIIGMRFPGSQNVNHVAIVIGGGQILHHLGGQLSCVEPYGAAYRRLSAIAWRHENLDNELAGIYAGA